MTNTNRFPTVVPVSDKPIRTRNVARREGEVVKPSEIIAVEGVEGWTLADRRVWNLLLANAWSDRLEDPEADFIISLAELRGSHDSNDRLRATLRKLQTTLVEARLPNGKTRTVQMLGAADLEDEERRAGTLEYDFHRKLVPLLRDSEIYTRMEVKVLSAFTSKYSLHLYEALAARINLRKTAETLEIGTLRQWLGVPDGKLSRWQSLKIKALEPAVREVNAYSPIAVQAEPVYRRRKVTAVKLSWSRKKPFSPAEQAASLEVNRHSAGRKARTTGAVEQAVDGGAGRIEGVPELPTGLLQRTRDAVSAETGLRLDIHAAHADWQRWVAGMKEPIRSPAGHFVDFCKRRAQREKAAR